MSLKEKMLTLIKKRPVLKKALVAVVDGKPVTLEELANLADESVRFPTDEEIWLLARESYLRVPPRLVEPFKVRGLWLELPPELTIEECIYHLEKRDNVGERLHKIYKNFLRKIYQMMAIG